MFLVSGSPKPAQEDVYREVAMLILDFKGQAGELDRIGCRCGMGEQNWQQFLSLIREACWADGLVVL